MMSTCQDSYEVTHCFFILLNEYVFLRQLFIWIIVRTSKMSISMTGAGWGRAEQGDIFGFENFELVYHNII